MNLAESLEVFKAYLKDKVPLEEAVFQQIASQLHIKSFKKGSFLLEEGKVCDDNYFVTQGLLKSYTIDIKGKEHIIQFAPECWFLADRDGILEHKPSKMYFEAMEDTTCILFSNTLFEEAACISPEFGKYNIKLLHNNIRWMQKRIIQLLSASAEERYLSFLKMYPNLSQRISQQNMASYLGMTPESLSRLRKILVKKI